MTARVLNISRAAAWLVVDHITVHSANDTVSVHVLEKNKDGDDLGRGHDIDGVTADELGASPRDGVSIKDAVSFVQALVEKDVKVTADEKPAEVE